MAQRSNFRGLMLILLPLVLSACLSTYLIVSYTASVITQQSNQFGQAITDHMANSVADHLANNDKLSLNVLLTELLSRGNFDSASVYDINNHLLVQVGRSTSNTIFTKEVTSQNAITGYVQLGFDRNELQSEINRVIRISIGAHVLILLLIWFFGTFYGDLFYLWMMHQRTSTPQVDSTTKTPKTVAPIQLPEATLLAVKLRPSRLLEQYKYRIKSAHALYGGELKETENGDIIICFRDSEQLSQAMYTGLLILALFERTDAPITLKLGIHTVKDQSIFGELEKARKHTSYLASISENQLLTSRLVHNSCPDSDQFDQQAFHGSMAPDGEVFSITANNCKDLIENQADQILNQNNLQ